MIERKVRSSILFCVSILNNLYSMFSVLRKYMYGITIILCCYKHVHPRCNLTDLYQGVQ